MNKVGKRVQEDYKQKKPRGEPNGLKNQTSSRKFIPNILTMQNSFTELEKIVELKKKEVGGPIGHSRDLELEQEKKILPMLDCSVISEGVLDFTAMLAERALDEIGHSGFFIFDKEKSKENNIIVQKINQNPVLDEEGSSFSSCSYENHDPNQNQEKVLTIMTKISEEPNQNSKNLKVKGATKGMDNGAQKDLFQEKHNYLPLVYSNSKIDDELKKPQSKDKIPKIIPSRSDLIKKNPDSKVQTDNTTSKKSRISSGSKPSKSPLPISKNLHVQKENNNNPENQSKKVPQTKQNHQKEGMRSQTRNSKKTQNRGIKSNESQKVTNSIKKGKVAKEENGLPERFKEVAFPEFKERLFFKRKENDQAQKKRGANEKKLTVDEIIGHKKSDFRTEREYNEMAHLKQLIHKKKQREIEEDTKFFSSALNSYLPSLVYSLEPAKGIHTCFCSESTCEVEYSTVT